MPAVLFQQGPLHGKKMILDESHIEMGRVPVMSMAEDGGEKTTYYVKHDEIQIDNFLLWVMRPENSLLKIIHG